MLDAGPVLVFRFLRLFELLLREPLKGSELAPCPRRSRDNLPLTS